MNEFDVVPGGRGIPEVSVYRGIKLFVFDVDGALTDGRIVLDSNGVESKFFHVHDGAGITLLRLAEIRLALLTGRNSKVVDFRAAELGIPQSCVRQGAKRKWPAFEQILAELNLKVEEAAFVGDDIIDLPVLERVPLACCPADAHPDIVNLCHVVSKLRGGRGAARTIIEHFFKRRGDGLWKLAVDRYLGKIQ